MTVYEKGLITVLACHALFVLISIPLLLRWVPRNVVYGFRTCMTLSDDTIWYEANAHFAARFIIVTIATSIAFIAVYLFFGLSPQTFLPVSVAALALPVTIAAVLTVRFVRNIEQ